MGIVPSSMLLFSLLYVSDFNIYYIVQDHAYYSTIWPYSERHSPH